MNSLILVMALCFAQDVGEDSLAGLADTEEVHTVLVVPDTIDHHNNQLRSILFVALIAGFAAIFWIAVEKRHKDKLLKVRRF